MTRLVPVAAPCALVLGLSLLVATGPPALDRTLILTLVQLVIVVGLYAFIGLSGVFSFGHMSFMAVGAYAAGLLTIPAVMKALTLPELPAFLAGAELAAVPATLVAAAVAAVFAAALAVPLTRLSGLQAGLATVAVLVIVRVVASNWDAVTGGTAGLAGIPTTTTLTVALVWALVAIVVVGLFQESRVGLRLRASRENDVAARSLGIGVRRERAVALALSAAVVGVGGALFAGQQGTVTPDQFYISITFLTIAMLVVGGSGSLAGAVVGPLFVGVALELLRRAESGFERPGLTEVGLGLLLLVTLALRPAGLMGGREMTLRGGRG
jgi:branched-chain amino acid transport system permease protein